MTFEQFLSEHKIRDWHQVQPWQLHQWLQTMLNETPEARAAALEAVSERFDSIGLADPTRSDIISKFMSDHWQLKEPSGWSTDALAMWRKLPFRVAKYISDKRRQDILAVKKIQNLSAVLRKMEEEKNNAANQAA